MIDICLLGVQEVPGSNPGGPTKSALGGSAGRSPRRKSSQPAVNPSRKLHYTARNIVLPWRATSKRTGWSFVEEPTAWSYSFTLVTG